MDIKLEKEAVNIWDVFETKLDDLIVSGYNLPGALQPIAIDHIEERLVVWKKQLPPKDGVHETPVRAAVKAVQDTPKDVTPDIEKLLQSEGNAEKVPENNRPKRRGRPRKKIVGDDLKDKDSGLIISPTYTVIEQLDQEEGTKGDEEDAVADANIDSPRVEAVDDEDYVEEIDDEDEDDDDDIEFVPVAETTRKTRGRKRKSEGKTSETDSPDIKTEGNTPKKRGRKKKTPLKTETPEITEPKVVVVAPESMEEETDVIKNNIAEEKEVNMDWRVLFEKPASGRKRGRPKGSKNHIRKNLVKAKTAENKSDDNADTSVVVKKEGEEKDEEEVVSYPCELCGKVYNSPYSLKKHMDIHERGSFKCDHCPKEFKSDSGYRTHLALHTGEGLLQCSYCTYMVGSAGMMRAHVDHVHKKIERHLCDTCGRGFVTAHRLKRHRESAHVEECDKPKYYCPHCDHMTHSQGCLKIHIAYKHTDMPGFVCTLCGTTVKHKATLKEHMKRHNGKKMFACAECNFRGVCEADVRKHVRRHHRQEPSFKCDICGKMFKQKIHRIRHMAIHTGEKNHKCKYCSYACNDSSNLKKHVFHVHKKNERVKPLIIKFDEDNASNDNVIIAAVPETSYAMIAGDDSQVVTTTTVATVIPATAEVQEMIQQQGFHHQTTEGAAENIVKYDDKDSVQIEEAVQTIMLAAPHHEEHIVTETVEIYNPMGQINPEVHYWT